MKNENVEGFRYAMSLLIQELKRGNFWVNLLICLLALPVYPFYIAGLILFGW